MFVNNEIPERYTLVTPDLLFSRKDKNILKAIAMDRSCNVLLSWEVLILLQIVFQFSAAAGMTQLAQGFSLNLANALTGNIEFFANLF